MTPNQKERIIKHGEQLNKIFNTGIDALTLCKKLRRIENAAHRLAEDACNHLSMESAEFLEREASIINRIAMLGITKNNGFRFNLDPRGYALKIDDEYMIKHNIDLPKDWGGYGILAPEFDKNGN